MKAVFYHQPKENRIGNISMNDLIKEVRSHKNKSVSVMHIVPKRGSDYCEINGSFRFSNFEDDSVGKIKLYSFTGREVCITFSRPYDELSKYSYDGNPEDIVYLMRFGELYLWIKME